MVLSREGFAQLQELDVQRYADFPEAPTIFTGYPNHAYLVILSSRTDLKLESNWTIVSDLSEPVAGRYVLVLEPVRQLIRISVPGVFRRTEIQLPDLSPKEHIYYSVEPANLTRIIQITAVYDEGRYEEVVDQLINYLQSPSLSEEQRSSAQHLLARSLYNLGRMVEMRNTLRQLMDENPDFAPDTTADPPVISDFIIAYQDSVRLQPPAAPTGLRAIVNGDQVRLQWNPNTETDLAGYRIYKGRDPLQKQAVATLRPESPTYLDPDVSSFQRYYYHITAYDNSRLASESEPSRTVEVEAQPPLSRRIELDPGDDSALDNITILDTNDSLLTITYSLRGAFRRIYDVSVVLSSNDGRTFNLTPTAFSGDYGPGVQDGPLKRIQWNVLADYPTGLSEQRYVMRLRAIPQPLTDQLYIQTDSESMIQDIRISGPSDSLVSIAYTLIGDPKQRYAIGLAVSRNNEPFSLIPLAVSGDVGRNVRQGSGKMITWAIQEDFPAGLDGTYRIKLTATEMTRSGRGRWWVVAGGSLLAGGGVAWVLSNGDDPEGKVPVTNDPPGRPR